MTLFIRLLLLFAVAVLPSCEEDGPTPPPPKVAKSKPEFTVSSQATGSLDTTNCDVIEGWAWDPPSPGRPLAIRLFDGDTQIAVVSANALRSDLAKVGIGDGRHSFSVRVPDALKDGKPHSISAKIASNGAKLPNGPKTITCTP